MLGYLILIQPKFQAKQVIIVKKQVNIVIDTCNISSIVHTHPYSMHMQVKLSQVEWVIG